MKPTKGFTFRAKRQTPIALTASDSLPHIPKGEEAERRKLRAWLKKRDKDCMKNVKFTPNPDAT